jgi:hypothetical protein
MGREQAKARGYNTGPAGGAPTGAGGAFGLFDQPGNSTTAAEAARQYQDTQRALGRGFGSIYGVPISMAAADNPPPAAAARGGGGGGGRDDDTIERQIKRYQDLATAAQHSMDVVRTSTDRTVESLTRQADVQQSINEAVTAFIRRYPQATQQQTEAFTAAVTAEKQLNDQRKEFLANSTAAEQTEKKFGDGVKASALGMIELNKQLATGRLNTTSYDRAVKELTESTQQSALAAQRYDDNLGSLVAGFEHAANAYARSNDLYSVGEQGFNALTSSMMEGLKALEGQSQKSFGQIAADFANMLAQMALQAAASAAFKAIFGAVSSGVTAAAAPAAGYSAGIGSDGLGWITPRAAGGPVDAGKPYVVGEQGPEYFVPTAAGNIVPMSQGNGGGVTVNVDMSGGGNSGGADPHQALEFGRRVKAAVVGVIQNEQRPGGTLYQRRS